MTDPEPPTFDPEQLASVCGEDPELCRVVIGDFLSQFTSSLDDLAEAVASRDNVAINRAAHTLRGAAATLGAPALAAASGRIEALGHARELDQTPDALTDILIEAEKLRAALTQYVRDRAA